VPLEHQDLLDHPDNLALADKPAELEPLGYLERLEPAVPLVLRVLLALQGRLEQQEHQELQGLREHLEPRVLWVTAGHPALQGLWELLVLLAHQEDQEEREPQDRRVLQGDQDNQDLRVFPALLEVPGLVDLLETLELLV